MVKTILKHVKQYTRASVATPIFMVLEVIMETLIPFMMASIIDGGVNAGDIGHIYRVGALMAAAACISLFAGIMGGKYGAKASAGLARNLREAMFGNIQRFAFSNIDKYSTAGLVTRLTTDVTNVQNSYQMLLRICMRSPGMLICAMVMAFSINKRIAAIYLAAIIILGLILAVIILRANKYYKRAFPKYDALNASVQENVSAIRVVKAYVREDYEKQRFNKASRDIRDIFTKAENILALNSPAMNLTIYGCILLISWVGAQMIVNTGGAGLTTGELMSLLTYCINILSNLMMLSMIFVMLSMSMASVGRIAEVLNEQPDLMNPEQPVYEIPNGSIDFDNVSFKYNKNAGDMVLKDVTLHIKPGETIGIIGGTGSAKTSLVSLIGRLYDVTEGEVRVGGRDVREYDIEALRKEVGVVLQKNVLFSGTLTENLRWGDKYATPEDCRRACRLACADEFIERLPDGYDTYVEQGGSNFSGGQRQRLCIARALLAKPKILILDDSTSAVDTATDAGIRRAFAEEIPGTTKLIIAQRISSVQNADRIIVMDEGRVEAFGTHDELMECCAIYRDVYESQTGGGGGDFDERGGDR